MKSFFFIILLLFFLQNGFSQSYFVEKSGDVLQIALPAVAFATAITDKADDKPYWQFAKAFAGSIIITQSLKRIIDKKRPNGGRYGFPSGHTTSAFSGATYLQIRYGWKIGVPALLLASYVGYSRIYSRHHDIWDVLGGATIGIGTALLFVKPKPNQKLTYYLSKQNRFYTISFIYKF